MRSDGLLPPVEEEELEWLRPQVAEITASDEVLRELATWMLDIQETMQLVWPAAVDGELVAPPSSHVLDLLVRSELLEGAVEEDPDIFLELTMRPEAGTVGLLPEEAQCTLCEDVGVARRGRYDSSYTTAPDGPWTYLCEEHFATRGPGRLGTGIGQYLLTPEEISPKVREAYLRAVEHWEGRGVTPPNYLPWQDE